MQRERPTVSILMPCFNEKMFIERAARSVLAQRFDEPFELIIVDDGSTDGSADLAYKTVQDAERGNLSCKLIRMPENAGNAKAFITAMSAARGLYYHVLDADDYWIDADKLRQQVAILEKHPDLSGCGHRTIVRSVQDGSESYLPISEPEGKTVTYSELIFGQAYFHTSAMLLRNYFYEPETDSAKVPPIFNEVRGDTVRLFVNASHGQIHYLPQTMSVYDDHGGGIWTGLDAMGRQALEHNLWQQLEQHGYLKRFKPEQIQKLKSTVDAPMPMTLRPVSIRPQERTKHQRVAAVNRISTLRELEIQAGTLAQQGHFEDGLQLISSFIGALTWDDNLSRLGLRRRLSSFEIDWHCARIGSDIAKRDSILPTQPVTATDGPIVFVVSGLAQGSDGHFEQLMDMMRLFKGKRELSIVSTEVVSSTATLPKGLGRDVQIHSNSDKALETKTAWLIKQLNELRASRIIAMPARHDVTIAAGLMAAHAPNIHLLSCADHGFGISRHSAAINSFIVRRPYDLSYLRKIEPSKDAILIPSFLRDKPSLTAPAWDGSTTTATICTGRKLIEQAYDFPYDQMVPLILRFGVARHVHIGELSEGAVNRIQKAMRGFGIDANRFEVRPIEIDFSASLKASGAHVLLSGFPTAETRPIVTAMGLGLPVIRHESYQHPMLSMGDLCYDGAPVWADADQLANLAGGINAEWLAHQRGLCKAFFEENEEFDADAVARRKDLLRPVPPAFVPSYPVPETRHELRRTLNELVDLTIPQA